MIVPNNEEEARADSYKDEQTTWNRYQRSKHGDNYSQWEDFDDAVTRFQKEEEEEAAREASGTKDAASGSRGGFLDPG